MDKIKEFVETKEYTATDKLEDIFPCSLSHGIYNLEECSLLVSARVPSIVYGKERCRKKGYQEDDAELCIRVSSYYSNGHLDKLTEDLREKLRGLL